MTTENKNRGRTPIHGKAMKGDSFSVDAVSHTKLLELSKVTGKSKATLIREGIHLVFKKYPDEMKKIEDALNQISEP